MSQSKTPLVLPRSLPFPYVCILSALSLLSLCSFFTCFPYAFCLFFAFALPSYYPLLCFLCPPSAGSSPCPRHYHGSAVHLFLRMCCCHCSIAHRGSDQYRAHLVNHLPQSLRILLATIIYIIYRHNRLLHFYRRYRYLHIAHIFPSESLSCRPPRMIPRISVKLGAVKIHHLIKWIQ